MQKTTQLNSTYILSSETTEYQYIDTSIFVFSRVFSYISYGCIL